MVNPFGAVLTQNKRALAFMWEQRAPLLAARRRPPSTRYVPFTVAPGDAADRDAAARASASDWVLKSDYGCEGEEVLIGRRRRTQDVWAAPAGARDARAAGSPSATSTPRATRDGRVANHGVFIAAGWRPASTRGCRRRRDRRLGAISVAPVVRSHDDAPATTEHPFVPPAPAVDGPGGMGRALVERGASGDAEAVRRAGAMRCSSGPVAASQAVAVVSAGVIADPSDDDDVDSAMDALELQRRDGWNVGRHRHAPCRWPTAATNDADAADWRTVLLAGSLADALAPGEARFSRFTRRRSSRP